MQLTTRGEVYCPVCGYSLHGLAAIFVAVHEPSIRGVYDIGAVCCLCYKTQRDACLTAVATLTTFGIHGITDITHGVSFYSPAYEKERGHSLADVLHARKTNTPLPLLPVFDTSQLTPPTPEPTLFDQQPPPPTTPEDRPRPPQLPHG